LVEAESLWTCSREIAAIEPRPPVFLAVAEAIGQQEIDDFIAPICGRREEFLTTRQIDRAHT
jgi:hypothetical protein